MNALWQAISRLEERLRRVEDQPGDGRALAVEIAAADRLPEGNAVMRLASVTTVHAAAGGEPLRVTVNLGVAGRPELVGPIRCARWYRQQLPVVGDGVWVVSVGHGGWLCLGAFD